MINLELRKANNRRYAQKHKEEIKLAKQRHYQKHKEEILAKQKSKRDAKSEARKEERKTELENRNKEIASIATKQCKKCGVEKEISEFYKESRNKNRTWSACKSCERVRFKIYKVDNAPQLKIEAKRSTLKAKYGLTLDEYEAKLAKQKGECGICSVKLTRDISSTGAAHDHDHETRYNRAFLCHRCNKKLGFVENFLRNQSEFLSMVKYLNHYQREQGLPEYRVSIP